MGENQAILTFILSFICCLLKIHTFKYIFKANKQNVLSNIYIIDGFGNVIIRITNCFFFISVMFKCNISYLLLKRSSRYL